jgi:hypothetical protein
MHRRLQVLKTVLWALVGALIPVTIIRFTHGLGAVTNLSDASPWGLWVGFDVMAGVALAAGGFVMAAAVHVLHLERYRGFVRPAILTAWLGTSRWLSGCYDLSCPGTSASNHLQHHSCCSRLRHECSSVLTLEFAPAAGHPGRSDR